MNREKEMTKPAQTLLALSRAACSAVAEGDFTPIVLEPYEWITGERGWMLGRPNGNGITWTRQRA